MITYNHEPFIKQAIEGVLNQNTNFDLELVIGEDCSTDNTRNICQEFAQKYKQIELLITENNLGMMPNFIRTLQACKGKYIALCEGDDYWTDPLKLQKQVDFLEANPDFSICYHKVKILINNRLVKDFITNNTKSESTINDIAEKNYIHTSTVLFRNGLIKEFPNWIYSSPMGDYPLYILLAQYGKIKYIDSIMSVYRVHNGGVWSQRDKDNIELYKRTIAVNELMIIYFNDDVKNILIYNLSLLYLDLSEVYLKQNEYELSLNAFIKSTEFSYVALHKRYYKYKIFGSKFKNILNNRHVFSPGLKKIIKRLTNRLLMKDEITKIE